MQAHSTFTGYISQRAWPVALTVGVLASLLIFVFPLYVPLAPLQSVSASYLAGFNNTVAIRSAVCLSFLVFLWAEWRRKANFATPGPLEDSCPIGRTFVAWLIAANATLLGLCGWLVMASGTRYLGDAGYIIEQATVLRDTGRALYIQIEFAYGPLLIWPEVWLSKMLHCGMPLAYFITLVVESSIGILLLAYVLNQIPTGRVLRRWTLVLFTLSALTPHLGLNYTYFRFASPLAVLLFATRQSSIWRCAVFLTLGEAMELLISPELALVLVIGAVVFASLRAVLSGRKWLIAGVAPIFGLSLLLYTAGRPYLQMASSFTHGALNLPVGPYPHVIVLLIALLWVVPVGVGSSLAWRRPDDARLIALFATSTAFMQSALGRCDPIHITSSGIGIFALSLMCFRGQRFRSLGYTWIAALALLVVWAQFVNQRFFQMRTATVLSATVMPHLPMHIRTIALKLAERRSPNLLTALSTKKETNTSAIMTAVQAATGTNPIATPLDLDPELEERLRTSHQYTPGYYAFWVDVMNARGEQRSIQDVDRCRFMLLPRVFSEDTHTPADIAALQGFRLPYKQRNAPLYRPGSAFRKELDDRWDVLATLGKYSLLQQKSRPAVTSADVVAGRQSSIAY